MKKQNINKKRYSKKMTLLYCQFLLPYMLECLEFVGIKLYTVRSENLNNAQSLDGLEVPVKTNWPNMSMIRKACVNMVNVYFTCL